jgi:hypothetical protein
VVRSFVAAANNDNRAAYVALCAKDIFIHDHVPPFVFQGPRACSDDWDAGDVWMKQNKLTWGAFDLSDPSFTDAAGGRVYAVFPLSAAFTRDGRRGTEKAIWSFVLNREHGAWRIESWAWATLDISFAGAP